MRIDHPETRPREFVDIVDGASVEVRTALWVNGHHGAIAFRHLIAWEWPSETHGVLQAGAASFFHGETQPWGAFFRC
jgi:hypothetical protein